MDKNGIPSENTAAAFPTRPGVTRGDKSLTLPPMTLQTVLALQAIGSPLLDPDPAGGNVPMSVSDLMLAVAAFRLPPDEMAALISRSQAAPADASADALRLVPPGLREDAAQARREIRERAARLAADIEVRDFPELFKAVESQIANAFSTFTAMRSPEGGDPLADRTGAPSHPDAGDGAGRSSSPST